jgi:NAD-dependent SIR2 family protein deacetylase
MHKKKIKYIRKETKKKKEKKTYTENVDDLDLIVLLEEM